MLLLMTGKIQCSQYIFFGNRVKADVLKMHDSCKDVTFHFLLCKEICWVFVCLFLSQGQYFEQPTFDTYSPKQVEIYLWVHSQLCLHKTHMPKADAIPQKLEMAIWQVWVVLSQCLFISWVEPASLHTEEPKGGLLQWNTSSGKSWSLAAQHRNPIYITGTSSDQQKIGTWVISFFAWPVMTKVPRYFKLHCIPPPGILLWTSEWMENEELEQGGDEGVKPAQLGSA